MDGVLNSSNRHIGEIADNLLLLETNQEDHRASINLLKVNNSAAENPVKIEVRWEPDFSLFCNLR